MPEKIHAALRDADREKAALGSIVTALISVSDKTGLDEFARRLSGLGVGLIASGGTGDFLERAGIEFTGISEVTGRVDFLGGLVKTLHPAIHAGILADRDSAGHMQELEALGYRKIDMVVVNFYPLRGHRNSRDLSFIDIGGPAMTRAAAKNFGSCVIVPDPSWYGRVLEEIDATGGVGEGLRWELARDALLRTGSYDARTLALVPGAPGEMADQVGGEISGGRPGEASGEGKRESLPGSMLVGMKRMLNLRYGENPHQTAGFYCEGPEPGFEVLKGDLSYNNILDLDCCLGTLAEFDRNAAVVVKHVGPCGVAEAEDGLDALERAYACDPLSAFGGVIGVNFNFTEECAAFLAKRFVECIVAPAFEEDALARLRKKKRTRVVALPGLKSGRVQSSEKGARAGRGGLCLRTAFGGMLIQSPDTALLTGDLDFVAGGPPGEEVVRDLLFAWKSVKHVKSNAIVFARSGRTLGIGAGQPSRVDSTKIAIRKAGEGGHDLKGSVMASDGFFPFADSIDLAHAAGARAIVQPGGSIRDGEVIKRAEELGVAMALTHTRHFRH
jgi:phosphoribosylaminoimidazolecarboxamide formyltransferase/IMP cyclohydrolase